MSWFTPTLLIWCGLTVPVLVYGLMGRDTTGRLGGVPRGPLVDARWGWFWMELHAMMVFPAVYLAAGERHRVGDVLVGLWLAHYLHRTLVWPLIVQRQARPFPAATACAGAAFNLVNGAFLGWHLARFADYPEDWFSDPRFGAGAALFILGAVLNISSDYRLSSLRARASGGAVLPRGGAFDYVSCPNLAGEIVEWVGFALMSWSLPGLAFALWTAANLVPRALWRHRWYREKFPGYPARRRALIPGLL
ncbi:MAG: 3-oxo-5-alpha-steroid 4-dehydrogenase [Acidobacteria bacterium]|nr:3-oxo-5-alpha-steroid 4-dehydrogenase [Acidobacteriota bacterium]